MTALTHFNSCVRKEREFVAGYCQLYIWLLAVLWNCALINRMAVHYQLLFCVLICLSDQIWFLQKIFKYKLYFIVCLKYIKNTSMWIILPLYSRLPLPFYPPVSNASVLLLLCFFILLLLFECIIVFIWNWSKNRYCILCLYLHFILHA